MSHARDLLPITLVLLALALSGCDRLWRKPTLSERDLAAIPDAVPRIEPKSAYGNPPNYEVFGKRYSVLPDSRRFVERGIASWYGPGFHDKLTSTREVYDMYAMTAAHKSLPLPTYAEITNLNNQRRVIVRINDRGPFVDGRVLDLSYVAAWKLGVSGPGTAPVEVRAIDPWEWLQAHGQLPANQPIPVGNGVSVTPIARAEPTITQNAAAPPPAVGRDSGPAREFYVQAGAFVRPDNARRLRDAIRVPDARARVVQGNRLHRVQLGPWTDRKDAERVRRKLTENGVRNAQLIDANGHALTP